MTIVTLTTDWGRSNHYSGSVKGTLLKLIPGVTIIDISHEVAAFDIMQACFILKNAYPWFPEGSIHLVGINSEAGIRNPHIAIKHNGHYFIGADNGIFSLLFDNQPEEAIEIDIHQDSDYFTFSTRDVFARVASLIASGKSLDSIGTPHKSLNHKIPFNPVVYPDRIIGKIIFIDGYENVVVNITKELFRTTGKNRPFSINFRSPGNSIHVIHQSYSDVVAGEKLAVFGSTGYLEIAINQGKASSLLGLQINDTVSIEFDSGF
jgi:S-adenosyl-L-methionine hydrolase (adenosine-forming)